MKNRFLLVLIAAVLCGKPQLFALSEKGQAAIQQLAAALIEEAKADQPKPDEPLYARQNSKAAFLPRLRETLARPDAPQFIEALAQLTTYFTSDAVQKNFLVLQSEIRIEHEENDKKRIAEITSTLDRARKTVLEARAPADLDETIAELGKYRQRAERSQLSEEVRAAHVQVEPVLQFVTNWQNYLSAQAKGNLQEANNALQNIAGNNSSPYLIPRSQILALIKKERNGEQPVEAAPQISIEKVLAEIKSLADVEKGLIQLRDLQQKRKYNGSDPLVGISQNLQQIDKTYQEYKAGLSINIDLNQGYNNGSTEIGNALLARLKSELMFLVLPRYVGAPEGSVPKKDEDVINFLERLTDEARARGDINVGIRAREAIRLLKRGNSFSTNDSAGIAAFISGQNQETAGQYLPAVLSYQTALKSGSDLVPSKIIGERLAAIQSAHPKEFDTAMDGFLNPPAPRYNDMPPQRYQNGMPDPRQNEAPARPALLIPPVSVNTPTPTASPVVPVTTPAPSATATPNP